VNSALETPLRLDANDLAVRLLDARTRLVVMSRGVIRDRAWRLGPRRPDGHVIHAVLAGGQRGWAGGETIATGAGDALWIPAGTPHELAIDPRAGAPRILRLRCRISSAPSGGPALVRHLPLAAGVLAHLASGEPDPVALRAGLALIAAGLAASAPVDDLPRRRLAELRRLLATDPSRPWTPAAAAAAIGCTGLALTRSLRAATGMPLRRWLMHERLRAAAGELDEGASVAEAARRHGWHDPFLFSRQFRAHFGASPARWRSAQRSQSTLVTMRG
jgi:AraC-like DNA-binding protein